MEFEVLS